MSFFPPMRSRSVFQLLPVGRVGEHEVVDALCRLCHGHEPIWVQYANHEDPVSHERENQPQNHAAARPVGAPKTSDFATVDDPVPAPGDGEDVSPNHLLVARPRTCADG